MSLSFYSNDSRRVSLSHPLPFESVFLRVCAFETQLWQKKAWKSVEKILDLYGHKEYKALGQVLENLNV